MTDESLLNELRRLRFTSDLPEHVIAELAEIATEEDVAAGSRIFREGAGCSKMMVIITGRVMLDMHVPSRGKVSVLSLGSGDMVGWSAVLGDGVMTASATATADTHLLAFDGQALGELCEQNHEIGYRFYHQLSSALSRRLVATRLQLLDLFAHDSPTVDPDCEQTTSTATQAAGNQE